MAPELTLTAVKFIDRPIKNLFSVRNCLTNQGNMSIWNDVAVTTVNFIPYMKGCLIV